MNHTDITRPTPNDRLIPWLLAYLESAGARRENITLLNGLGTHRPNTKAELEKMLTPEVVANFRCINHEPENDDAHVQLGVTRTEIEQIRGVAADGVIVTLKERGLIEEAGRAEVIGRPMTYATTPAFLEYFGLAGLDALPAADELRRILVIGSDGAFAEDSQPLSRMSVYCIAKAGAESAKGTSGGGGGGGVPRILFKMYLPRMTTDVRDG